MNPEFDRFNPGRGADINPTNRFERLSIETTFDHLEEEESLERAQRSLTTEYLRDETQSIVSHTDSPDIPFEWSINPYRGCLHGCSYCYARTFHEYLGFKAGTDFETKILVKTNAAELLKRWLVKNVHNVKPITLSGVTDPYQPAERKFRITRECLEVMETAHQSVCIITKNALVLRDLDLYIKMANRNQVHVAISLPTLDRALARKMEPRASLPAQRLRTIEKLSEAGIPVKVLIAPLIPGLTEEELPSILKAIKSAGALSASPIILRLPGAVQPIFFAWMERYFPDRVKKVEQRIRSMKGGKLNRSEFGLRFKTEGNYIGQVKQMFRVFSNKEGLVQHLPPLDSAGFQPENLGISHKKAKKTKPADKDQLFLFDLE
ncbi:DNA repair photolyase [Planctomycetales bacterium 10988]|nr:DNA repair photolyase [Planctomycetales bacterium 10988]